jgi:hypothetical protein
MVKLSLLKAFWGPQSCDTLRLSHFLHNQLTDCSEVVSLTCLLSLTPRKTPGTHFCYKLSIPQGHNAAGRIRSTEKESNDLMKGWTHNLPAWSTVPQPTILPHGAGVNGLWEMSFLLSRTSSSEWPVGRLHLYSPLVRVSGACSAMSCSSSPISSGLQGCFRCFRFAASIASHLCLMLSFEISQNSNVHYYVHETPLKSILNQMSPVNTFPSYFIIIHFNINFLSIYI